jgi:hypothetical protein
LKTVGAKKYDDLKAAHVEDYASLKSRVSLNLPGV